MFHTQFPKSVLAALVLLSVGCYKPDLGNPGYYCHAADNPACPDTQKCVNGRCVPAATVVGDMGGSGSDGSTSHDMANGSRDMAIKTSTDMAMQSLPDLSSMGPLCQCPTAGPCILGCVGPDCCLEDTILGLCNPDPTCTPN